jgi:hypothetical protein
MMLKIRQILLQLILIPAGVPVGTEKNRSLIVVDTRNGISQPMKVPANL